ncbi:MAG: septal ring lytic transglycosylase RlpA family protein [Pseudomonadota bacterium]
MIAPDNLKPIQTGGSLLLRKSALKFGLIFCVLFFFALQNACGLEGKAGRIQAGKASYYANKFHGRKTASGEIYDKDELTAAHPFLPFGTIVRVTNLRNEKSIFVRVNDRGNLPSGRVIDLSNRAAKKLDFIHRGLAPVELEVVEWGDS